MEKGRADKLILLHGPNGSAKTSIVDLIVRALEFYSATPEGVLYTHNWLFTDTMGRRSLGFDSAPSSEPDTFAYLDAEEITCRFPCELRDHPFWLIPREYRREILESAFQRLGGPPRLTAHALEGELCQKCREIHDHLLAAYQGDWRKVVRHVQVERVYVSRRYRVGAVTIEPQRNVDAAVREVNVERHHYIPPILANANLMEPGGDLVDANLGICEYSDLLKRPMESYKYLLTTSERNTITLGNFIAYLNQVMIATSNEKHLTAFKQTPDFSSFKGRIELVPTPYLLEISKEERIYAGHLRSIAGAKHVAPHTARVIALWAVLTRLRRPRESSFPPAAAPIVARLTPIQKARLYDECEAPSDLSGPERRELQAAIGLIRAEYDDEEDKFEELVGPAYEGRRGASPREMMATMAQAAHDARYHCLHPIAALAALRELCRETSNYDFLRLEPDHGYHDVGLFFEAVEEDYQGRVVDEVNDAAGLVEEQEYDRLFRDYFLHVKAFDAREKVRNPTTHELEPPNEELMHTVEEVVQIKDKPDPFRRNLITRIGAFSLDHKGERIDYHFLFPDIFKALKDDYFKRRDRYIRQIQENILKHGTDEFAHLAAGDQTTVRRALARLKVKYGYCDHCVKDVLIFVLRRDRAPSRA